LSEKREQKQQLKNSKKAKKVETAKQGGLSQDRWTQSSSSEPKAPVNEEISSVTDGVTQGT